MKSRLNEITLAQFIELLCGNYFVLSDSDEVKESELQERARSLIASYRFIADEPGMRALIADKEESVLYYPMEEFAGIFFPAAKAVTEQIVNGDFD